jgi:hypothetical protein
MPAHDRVRRHDRRNTTEKASSELLSLLGQPAALIVRESNSAATELLLEDAVLFDQVLDRALLLSADPADGGQEQGAKREAVVQHSGRIATLRVL